MGRGGPGRCQHAAGEEGAHGGARAWLGAQCAPPTPVLMLSLGWGGGRGTALLTLPILQGGERGDSGRSSAFLKGGVRGVPIVAQQKQAD